MKVNVFAKLNLSLNVFQKVGEYHPIDSVAITVRLGDVVFVRPRKDNRVTLRGCKGIPVEENSAYKAAVAFVERFGTNGCDIKIKKRIPQGAGMGGSSADAAAVIGCLCRLNGFERNDQRVSQLCAELGSDINFMRFGGLARMTGKGDVLQFAEDYPEMYFAVTFFDTPLLTRDVYSRFDELGESGEVCDNDVVFQNFISNNANAAFQLLDNGLQKAAVSLLDDKSSELTRYFDFCQSNGYVPHMTGSGSAFFIPFTNRGDARIVAKRLKNSHFRTRAVDFGAWGIETREFLFDIV